MSTRVLVIGLDSMDHRLVERWCDEGRLPNIAGLRARSAAFALDNSLDSLPGAIWVELSTGRSVGTDSRFYVPEQLRTGDALPRTIEPDEIDTTKDFWTVASAHGRRVLVFDVPERVPHRGLNGVHLAEWGPHDSSWSIMSEPPALAEEVRRAFPVHPVPDCDVVHGGGADEYARLARDLVAGAALRTEVATHLLDLEEWDLAVIGFIEVHCVGHQFWSFANPRHPVQVDDPPAELVHAIRDVYAATDAAIGRLLERTGPDPTVVLLASHGFGPFVEGAQLLPELLQRLGQRAAPSSIAHAPSRLPEVVRRGLRHIVPMSLRQRRNARTGALPPSCDLASPANRAVALPNNRCGAIRLNLRGREPRGRVEPGAEADALLDEIRAELEALVDPRSGERIVRRVTTPDEQFGPDHHPDLPDLMITFRNDLGPLEACVGPRVGTIESPWFPRGRRPDGWPVNLRRTGDHAPPAKLWVSGPTVAPSPVGSGRAIDVAPTVLALLGVPTPATMEGTPLTDPGSDRGGRA